MDTKHADGDDWLEQALRADARAPAAGYVADDGFTARVMARLPSPATLPAWRRPVVVMLWLIAGGAGVALLPDLFYTLFGNLVEVIVAQPLTWSHIAAALMLLGATTWSAVVYAMRTD